MVYIMAENEYRTSETECDDYSTTHGGIKQEVSESTGGVMAGGTRG